MKRVTNKGLETEIYELRKKLLKAHKELDKRGENIRSLVSTKEHLVRDCDKLRLDLENQASETLRFKTLVDDYKNRLAGLAQKTESMDEQLRNLTARVVDLQGELRAQTATSETLRRCLNEKHEEQKLEKAVSQEGLRSTVEAYRVALEIVTGSLNGK